VGGWAYDNEGKRIRQFQRTGGAGHQANFIEAVRSRKVADLNADVLDGHLSSALCHMGNVSHRVGCRASLEQVRRAVAGNAYLAESVERLEQHIRANEVDLETTPLTLGADLTMDPQREVFTGPLSEEANRLLRRDYREPFVIPEVT
jgi:hypothetical protein